MHDDFAGHERYAKLISETLTLLFSLRASNTNRNDSTLYSIFTYLAVIRLEEMKFEEFRRFVLSQDQTKMFALFDFLWNEEMQNTAIKEAWYHQDECGRRKKSR